MRIIALAASLGATLWLAVRHVRLALVAEFGLDEFQYAAGAWKIARGEVIYRDFFEHHFPLLHQLLAWVWRLLGDDPTDILTLRLAFLPVFAFALVAAWRLAGGSDERDDVPWRGAGLWAAPVLLAVPTLSAMAIQLRPDVLAGSLFLAALAVLGARRPGPRVRGALAGVLAALALWTTLKFVFFGLIFVAALAADLWRRRSPDDDSNDASDGAPRYLLADPIAFVAGSAGVLTLVALWLVATGSLGAWWHWCIEFSFRHQEVYPGFPWTKNFAQVLDHSLWLLIFGAVGIVSTVRRGVDRGIDPLLLGAVATTAASFLWQTAPYLYSLVPFTLVLGIFAARGLAVTARLGRSPAQRVFVAVLLALLVVGQLRQVGNGLDRLAARTNERQLQTLARIGAMTSADDPVFHQWAGQVARPSAHYFYFLEAATHRLEAERLHRELVPALIEKGVTVYWHHDLFDRLPANLRAYLLENFLLYDRDLWVYGRRFETREGTATGTFTAVRDDIYFVSPPTALGGDQTLRIDGAEVTAPIFRLPRGNHRIEYQGQAPSVDLVWMPRDGVPFEPRPELRPTG